MTKELEHAFLKYAETEPREITPMIAMEWLYSHLAEATGEFDFSSYENEPSIGTTRAYELTEREIWEGKREAARWQFEQDCARIGMMKFWQEEAEGFAKMRDELQAEYDKLEAHLAESEDLHQTQTRYGIENMKALQDKLSASEARVKELERTQMKIIPMGKKK